MFLEEKREFSLQGLIATAERGYGFMDLLKTFSGYGIVATVFIMTLHINK